MSFPYSVLDKPAAHVLSDVYYDFVLEELHTHITGALRNSYKELMRQTIRLYEGMLRAGIEVRVIVLARSNADEWLVYCPKGNAMCVAVMHTIQEVRSFKNCVNYKVIKQKPRELVRLFRGTSLTPNQIYRGIELHRAHHAV